MPRTEISPAEALKAFKTKPEVQTAKAGKIPVLDGEGKEIGKRDGFITKAATMSESHILAAANYDDGRVVVVTIDGKRHEARA